jgi:uncharacterized protein
MTTPDSFKASKAAEVGMPTVSSPPDFPITSSQEDQPVIAPVRMDERIPALDTIRGFGLLGILLMNICSFGLPAPAYDNPAPAGGATGLNLLTWCLTTVFADGKMRAIFSMAFGASVYLLIDRLSRKGAAADAADIHYRRMLWLLLFGIIHAYLIWDGDILFYYAMMGLLLYPLRKLSPRVLLIAGGILVLLMAGDKVRDHFHLKNLQREYNQAQADEKAGKKLTSAQEDTKKEWEDTLKLYFPPAEDLKEDTDAHLGRHLGGYFKLVAFRAKVVYGLHSRPIYMPWWFDYLAMMLIGMALLKLGVLTGSYPIKFYVWMALLSFAIGLSVDSWSAWSAAKGHFSMDSWVPNLTTYEIGRFTALGYIAVILLVIKSGMLQAATRTLACVGRMAFSNYILTSLICTTIFNGYGFGLFGKLQRYQLYGIVPLVWLVILIVSPIWLRHFRFGPLEWAWRSLTYWKKQPFRIRDRALS